mmetsp:Transcript_60048/g.127189  ORF Transcript_60048/g.127189 Transcript_60048/m.127189 type:complete len:262 (+) Transcript_60048:103-888(+)|eukprot:CAMPEP_0206536928 /NCGR_PEP_ID=MMETSP0325_2-20121206/7037_1 /ASSEMBLY_ACC=CAM_ASM_000347 /TAXON_ID=2866 /ORGANISM="Crypthecodinium cohnii, Strain Seligo" /LENGTH=261 /DNA_ID=CAMNT_0054034225 /DNA_START=30 /DNA_END=815 /DNA_ORIENTATION=+
MLHVQKNKLVTNVAISQVEVRQMEIDWYCGNYGTIIGQAATLAGFAFTQLTTPIPAGNSFPRHLDFVYVFLTAIVLGLELSCIILSSSITVWAPSLALKGKSGTADLHKAIDCLKDYHSYMFMYFIVGWILFFISNIFQVWIYFKRSVAVAVTVPLGAVVVMLLWYTISITTQLRLDEDSAVKGKIDHFLPYEGIADIDSNLSSYRAVGSGQGERFCPVHESHGGLQMSTRSAPSPEFTTMRPAAINEAHNQRLLIKAQAY